MMAISMLSLRNLRCVRFSRCAVHMSSANSRRIATRAAVDEQAKLDVVKDSIERLEGNSKLAKKLETVERWIVFSDLHVHDRHDPEWQMALEAVDRLAQRHKAGVLFLGDFWEARTSVRHATLNQVQRVLSGWRHPTIALVGNHDQVNQLGLEHGMLVLETFSSNWAVITHPTLYQGALWLPYRAEESVLREAIAAASQQSGAPVKAIFAHVDIIGASVNSAHQAKSGLSPKMFPDGVPVFSGHYHKPHTVNSTDITYIGSPFEMSFSEARQEKRVLLLDRTFQLVESIPISIGRRHHLVSMAEASASMDFFRSGDRIRVEVPFEQRAQANEVADGLRGMGAEAEMVLQKPDFRSVMGKRTDVDLLQPHELLTLYLKQAEKYRGDSAEAAMLQLLEERGAAILSRVLMGRQEHGDAKQQATMVHIDRVELEGFRCFRDRVEYDFQERGIIALTGQNEQDTGTPPPLPPFPPPRPR